MGGTLPCHFPSLPTSHLAKPPLGSSLGSPGTQGRQCELIQESASWHASFGFKSHLHKLGLWSSSPPCQAQDSFPPAVPDTTQPSPARPGLAPLGGGRAGQSVHTDPLIPTSLQILSTHSPKSRLPHLLPCAWSFTPLTSNELTQGFLGQLYCRK